MASLSLKHVYKVYPNGNKAVSDFSMEIADKEFIVFVGPSGCGKSTTLRMIAGLENISAGEIYIDDLLVNDVEPKDRDIAMVFQNYALYPHISVYENMAFGLKIRHIAPEEIHRRVLEAAEILGITEYLNKKPREMSGGQRQRVALGRAIVREPKVFLLDEPLSNLDAKLRTQMRGEISKLYHRLKTTFVYVTHDQTEAMTMGTRIVVMRGGFIQQVDTPRNLYSDPQTKFVASFIGTPQMNFWNVTLHGGENGVEVRFSDVSLSLRMDRKAFLKVRPGYLDGTRRVIFGIRAERIAPLSEEERKRAVSMENTAMCTVSHVEELGDEALVYGDLSAEADRVTGSGTGIVFRTDAESGMEIRSGDVIPVRFDLSQTHFFDGESEISIRPKIPESNVTTGEIRDGVLRVYGLDWPIPPALLSLKEGTYEVEIPPEALDVTAGKEFRISAVERFGDRVLTHLERNGTVLFAVGEWGEEGTMVRVRPRMEQLSFYRDGASVHSALKEKNALYGSIVRTTVTREGENGRRRKTAVYCFEIAEKRYPIPEEMQEMLLKSTGIGVLKKRIRYEFGSDGCRIGGAGQGIPATLEEILDYGNATYLVLRVGEKKVILRCEGEVTGEVSLLPDLSRMQYVDDALDVILL